MTITIKLRTENAAFDGDARDDEIARLVERVAMRLRRGAIATGKREAQTLVDLNGDAVGSVTVTGK